jgi:hypothetical protein
VKSLLSSVVDIRVKEDALSRVDDLTKQNQYLTSCMSDLRQLGYAILKPSTTSPLSYFSQSDVETEVCRISRYLYDARVEMIRCNSAIIISGGCLEINLKRLCESIDVAHAKQMKLLNTKRTFNKLKEDIKFLNDVLQKLHSLVTVPFATNAYGTDEIEEEGTRYLILSDSSNQKQVMHIDTPIAMINTSIIFDHQTSHVDLPTFYDSCKQ